MHHNLQNDYILYYATMYAVVEIKVRNLVSQFLKNQTFLIAVVLITVILKMSVDQNGFWSASAEMGWKYPIASCNLHSMYVAPHNYVTWLVAMIYSGHIFKWWICSITFYFLKYFERINSILWGSCLLKSANDILNYYCFVLCRSLQYVYWRKGTDKVTNNGTYIFRMHMCIT